MYVITPNFFYLDPESPGFSFRHEGAGTQAGGQEMPVTWSEGEAT